MDNISKVYKIVYKLVYYFTFIKFINVYVTGF